MDRYEKALELARSYYDKDANTFLDTIFPELKESREEQIRKAIIKSLDLPFMEAKIEGTDVTYEEAVAWLEKQKHIEWSEEDEKHRQWILECLADGKRKVPEFTEQYQAAFDWFKSLRPLWRPSEEQMEALERCAEYLGESDNEDADILAGLYEQLKQL